MTVKKVQLYLDRDKTIEASPETSANCVILSDGNDLQKVLDNDLTTPTVVHEETSFKVGVGDVNVSSSVVDGEVGRMVIKGKTYQNILPEPSTPVLTNNKEMFKVNEGLDPNVEVVDGISKSAILKGKTGYRDKDTGEILDAFEEGRNLELVSVRVPVLTTIGKNLIKDIRYEQGSINGTTGQLAYATTRARTVEFIKLRKNVTYTFSVFSEQENVLFREFLFYSNASLDTFKKGGVGAYRKTFTYTPQEDEFCRIVFINNTSPEGTVDINLIKLQLEESSTATPYEPHKSNILSTPQDLELRGIGDVKDTLDLINGEKVERIGEIVLDGSENWALQTNSTDIRGTIYRLSITDIDATVNNTLINCICDKAMVGSWSTIYNTLTDKTFAVLQNQQLRVQFDGSLEELKTWLSEVQPTVQYLKTESIKTVDLSSSGNWEKVILDGSENWGVYQRNNSVNFTNTSSFQAEIPNANFSTDSLALFTNSHFKPYSFYSSDREGAFIKVNKIRLAINKNKLVTDNVEGFKQYMRQNPVTVWYQTDASLDSTQVKQPIFFKDGHVQLSSGTDNSLIPTLDYQAKTSNSYVMDLMKNGVWYTMKAKSASGTLGFASSTQPLSTNGKFAVDGASFQNANKLMVINGSVEDLMILEGDLTSKTIPYFKGIKSAFEGESKIEVLSCGKNLLNPLVYENRDCGIRDIVGKDIRMTKGSTSTTRHLTIVKVKPSSTYTLSLSESSNVFQAFIGCANQNYIGTKNILVWSQLANNKATTFTTDESTHYLFLNFHSGDYKVQLEESSTATAYEPYKSNVSKIPLLSPLRSLPNGVCDELIIDRMKKKATLVRRLDCVTFDGSSDESWHTWGIDNSISHLNSYHYVNGINNTKDLKVKTNPSWFTSHLGYGGGYTQNKTGASLNDSYFAFSIPKNLVGAVNGDTNSMCINNARKYLSQNPTTVYYELATPVVTEIDLEGFPLIYKDGHIFLNSEIAPVVEIDYSINQSQQIQSNNETLQRHELDILDLDNLIVSFVNAEYNLRLLKFDMELSMMALAE